MSKGESGLFHTVLDIAASDSSLSSENAPPFQGDRTREEYTNLARDPAHGNKIDAKSRKERAIALDLERQGKIGRVIRDPQADKGADFIDTMSGQKWDIKSPISHPNGHTSPRKGAFDVARMIANVKKEISRGHNVILDTRRLIKSDKEKLKDAVSAEGLDSFIIWYERKGE